MSDNDVRPLGDWLRAAYEPHAAGTGCPPPERFLEAEMGELPEDERRRLAEHARTCPACAAEQELARLFHEAPEEAGVAGEAVGYVVARLEQASPVRPLAEVAEPPVGKIVPFPARSPRPVQDVQPARRETSKVRPWRLAAAAALLLTGSLLVWRSQPTQMPLPAPPGESEVFRGADVEVLSPLGEMESVPTELRWQEKAGAESYRLRLIAIDDTVLWEDTVAAPPARLPDAVTSTLHPGVAYVWTVEALDANGARVAVSEPARFRARP